MLINTFLEILFDLTLFFLFIVLIYKIFKDYASPFLQEQILLIKKRKQDQQDKINLLGISKQRMEEQISDQLKRFDLLEEKVANWQVTKNEANQKLEESNKILLQNIKVKRSKQLSNLSLLKMQKRVVPQAIAQAVSQIKMLYGGANGENLLKELIIKIHPNKNAD